MSFRNLKAWAAVPAVLWWSGVSSAALYAQTFEKSKMYVEQDHKLKLKRVTLDVQDDAVVATLKGKDADVLRIPYGEITAMEYEKSKHRRWKTGIILFAPMLIMKSKTRFGIFCAKPLKTASRRPARRCCRSAPTRESP